MTTYLPDLAAHSTIAQRLCVFARDIKVSHTIFAMPWAILATFMAAGGIPAWGQLGLILLCMVTARTVAMAANRLLDARLDALNPRTAQRAVPSGQLSRAFVSAALIACGAAFVVSTAGFWWFYRNPWPALLAGPVLAFLAAYPLLKRFTRWCHYYLGAALGLAPLCAWIAIAGRVDWPPVLMGLAVTLWTAGFDIIYACQDYASDCETGVHSMPARLGIGPALWVSRATHLLCLAALVALGRIAPPLGGIYFTGVALIGLLLIVEHTLVSAQDLSRIGLAFFTINGVISLIAGGLGIADVLL